MVWRGGKETPAITQAECSREMLKREGVRVIRRVREKERGRVQVLIGQGLGGECQAGLRYWLSQSMPRCEARPSGKPQMCEVIMGKRDRERDISNVYIRLKLL